MGLVFVAHAYVSGSTAFFFVNEAVFLVHVINILFAGAVTQQGLFRDFGDHPAGTPAAGIALAGGHGSGIIAYDAHVGLAAVQVEFDDILRSPFHRVGADVLAVMVHFAPDGSALQDVHIKVRREV